jgi:hypothetical protein
VKKYLLLLLALTLGFNASAQLFNKYVPGYVVMNNGDTRRGLLKYDKSIKKVLFKEGKDSAQQKLTAYQLKSFVMEEDSFAVIKNFENGSQAFDTDFAEVICAGRVNLYLHVDYGQQRMMSSQVGGAMMMSGGGAETYIAEKGGVKYRIRRRDFKDTIFLLVGDDAGLVKRINEGELQYEELDEILYTYNKARR